MERNHYHPLALDIAGHAAARRLNKKDRLIIELNVKAGVSPRDTLTALRLEDPGALAHARTIQNERVRIKKERLKENELMKAYM